MVSRSTTLTKSFVKAVKLLQIEPNLVGNILAVDESVVSRLLGGDYQFSIDRGTEWISAVELVRMCSLLNTIFSESNSAVEWVNGFNTALGDKPVHLIQNTDGIIRVNSYLLAHGAGF